MSYTKEQFGKNLKEKIDNGYSPRQIGEWAFEVYFKYGRDFDPEMDEIVQNLFMMEEGLEFEYSKEELLSIANRLISSEL